MLHVGKSPFEGPIKWNWIELNSNCLKNRTKATWNNIDCNLNSIHTAHLQIDQVGMGLCTALHNLVTIYDKLTFKDSLMSGPIEGYWVDAALLYVCVVQRVGPVVHSQTDDITDVGVVLNWSVRLSVNVAAGFKVQAFQYISLGVQNVGCVLCYGQTRKMLNHGSKSLLMK